MTRYCASGARSHFTPSSIPHTKCFKNLQRLERKKGHMGQHIKNLFSIYNPMHPLILKIYFSLIMVCIGMSCFIIYRSHINEHGPG